MQWKFSCPCPILNRLGTITIKKSLNLACFRIFYNYLDKVLFLVDPEGGLAGGHQSAGEVTPKLTVAELPTAAVVFHLQE